MNRARGAKPTKSLPRELCFSKSDPDENLFDVDFEISKATDAADGAVAIEGYLNSTELDDDIDGDVVDPRAFEKQLKHFMRHPVIRREHKHPIGNVLKVEFRPEGPWFEGIVTHDAPNEPTRDMIKKKVLRGISARFNTKPTPENIELLPNGKGRMRIKNARLLEVTITDVPRNSGGHFQMKEPIRAAFQKSLGAGSSANQQEEKGMKILEILARLLTDAGHACKADDEMSIMKSVGELISTGKGAAGIVMIAKALGKPENSTPEQLVEALNAAVSKDGTIAKSVHEQVITERNALQLEVLLLKNADRITPANKEFAKSLAQTDTKIFEQWVATQPPVPGPITGITGDPKGEQRGDGKMELSPADLQFAKALGAITDEKKLKEFVFMKPHEVASQLLKQPVSETAHDKVHALMHNAPWENVKEAAA